MKKLFSIAILTLALGACGGKPKAENTMKNTGGNPCAIETGGASYGGDAYGNPCAGNPCAPM
jgi:hypothetical protein